MREGPLRGHKNRIPWSHHDMAQTFSLWGKTMFLTAVRVFITFSSFFFPLCNFASWRMLYIKDMTFGNPALLLCEILWQAPYVLTALSTSVYLFIYLGRNQREHAIQLMRSTVSLHPKKKKRERRWGRRGWSLSYWETSWWEQRWFSSLQVLLLLWSIYSDSQISRHLGNIN